MFFTYHSIVRLTDDFCQRHLDQEYAELARKMAASLARKRPSPLRNGAPETWACGIIYALGKVNSLFDKTRTPHMKADELCRLFGVSGSAGSAKARRIMDILKIRLTDPKWHRPGKTKQGKQFLLAEIDDFELEVEMLKNSEEFMAFLDERSKERATTSIEELRKELGIN